MSELETKHTPGPWVMFGIGPDITAILPAMREGSICEFSTVVDPSDARLMTAAPKMLQALIDIHAQLECPARNTNRGRAYREGVTISSGVREAVRAAIEDATGATLTPDQHAQED